MSVATSLLCCLRMRELGLSHPRELNNVLKAQAQQNLADNKFYSTKIRHENPVNAPPSLASCHEFIALGHGTSTTLWNLSLRIKLWDYITPLTSADDGYNSYLCRRIYMDETRRVIQVYFLQSGAMKLELLDKGKVILTREEPFHPKKIWMHNTHVFFTIFEENQYWICVWKINQNTLHKHQMVGCGRATYQDVEPVYNQRYFVITAGDGIYSRIFVYDMDNTTFCSHELGFDSETPQTIDSLHLKDDKVYVCSYFLRDRIKHQIVVFDLNKKTIEEKFCRGLNGVSLGLQSAESSLVYRIYNRGAHSLNTLDLESGELHEISELPLQGFNSGTIFLEGDLVNLFYNDGTQNLSRIVINYKTGTSYEPVRYPSMGMFAQPIFYANVVFLPYYTADGVEFYIEDFTTRSIQN